MTTFQIIAICLLGAGTLTAIGFTVAFLVEAFRKVKVKDEVPAKEEEVEEIDLDEMLARLEEATKKANEEENETPAVVVNVNVNGTEAKQEHQEEIKEEVKEEPKVENPVVVEEVPAEVVEPVEEKEEKSVEEKPTTIIINNFGAKEGPEFDYSVRLEKIKESQNKIERDLDKTNKNVLKYERTIRRKERNEKMLEKRALELTNLNLLMYSVTDIKNVDAEKKARQEELTAHIAELKASIQDADEYIEANKEKYDNNLKLQEYLTKEQKRYAEEIKELEKLIAEGATD